MTRLTGHNSLTVQLRGWPHFWLETRFLGLEDVAGVVANQRWGVVSRRWSPAQLLMTEWRISLLSKITVGWLSTWLDQEITESIEKTYLGVKLYGYFLRGFPEEERCSLTVDITIQWRGVHRINNSIRYCQLHPAQNHIRKRESQLRNSLRLCLDWGLMGEDSAHCSPSQMRQAALDCRRKLAKHKPARAASKQHPSRVTVSRFLLPSSFPDFPQWQMVTWKHKPN